MDMHHTKNGKRSAHPVARHDTKTSLPYVKQVKGQPHVVMILRNSTTDESYEIVGTQLEWERLIDNLARTLGLKIFP